MAFLTGFERYITLNAKETTWNTYNGSGTLVYVPVTDYGVTITQQYNQAELYTGVVDLVHNQPVSASIGGSIACPLWTNKVSSKSIAQWLIDWGLNRSSPSVLDSYSAVLAEEAISTSRRHTGLTVNTMTIAGTNSQGVAISLDVLGGGEASTGSIPGVPETAPPPFGVMFNGYGGGVNGVEMYIDSGTSSVLATTGEQIRSFNLVVNNTATAYYTNSYFPTAIGAGRRKVGFNFQVFKDSDAWDLLRRSSAANEFHIKLMLKGPDGLGSYSTITFEMERASFSGCTDQHQLDQYTEQGLAMMALKPGYSGHGAIQVAYT
jgi:hypothetical protein